MRNAQASGGGPAAPPDRVPRARSSLRRLSPAASCARYRSLRPRIIHPTTRPRKPANVMESVTRGAVSRPDRLRMVMRFDGRARGAADEPEPSPRLERRDRPLGGRHPGLHDADTAADGQRRAGVAETLHPRDGRRPLGPALHLAQDAEHHLRRRVDLRRDAELHSSPSWTGSACARGACFHPRGCRPTGAETSEPPPTASPFPAPCAPPRCGWRRPTWRWPRRGSCARCPPTG